MLWAIVAVRLILWLLGFSLHLAGLRSGGRRHSAAKRSPGRGLAVPSIDWVSLMFRGNLP